VYTIHPDEADALNILALSINDAMCQQNMTLPTAALQRPRVRAGTAGIAATSEGITANADMLGVDV